MDTESVPTIPSSSTTSPPTDFQDIFQTFSWNNVQSNLSDTRPRSSRIPPDSDPLSAFLDLQKVPRSIDGRAIAGALPEEAVGIKFRADIKFIQVFFDTEEDADTFIAQGELEVDTNTIPILPPKGKLSEKTLIRLMNVPVRAAATIRPILVKALEQWCIVEEIQPITIKDTKLVTSRWEAVVSAPSGYNLAKLLTPTLKIMKQTVLVSWPGSPPNCIHCLETGHLRKDCPKRATTAPLPRTTAPIQPNNKKTYAKAVAQPTPVPLPPSTQTDSTETAQQTSTPTQEAQQEDQSTLTNQPEDIQMSDYEDNSQKPLYDKGSPFLVEGTPDTEDTDTNANTKSQAGTSHLGKRPYESSLQSSQSSQSQSRLSSMRSLFSKSNTQDNTNISQ